MIRATAHAATPRRRVRRTTARRVLPPVGMLMTLLALVAPAGGQHAAADERPRGGDIQVVAAGVAFEPGPWNDGVAYVIRPWGSHDDGQAFFRTLTQEEQSSGWAAFWEAGSSYPGGYCLVWVEVENAGSWHETGGDSVCTAAEPAAAPAPPQAAGTNDRALAATADEPSGPATVRSPEPSPVPTSPTPTSMPAPTPTPNAPAPSASPSASPTGFSTPSVAPSPSPSSTTPGTARETAPEAAPGTTPETTPGTASAQDAGEQPAARMRAGAAEQHDIISPLGWVAVLGGGAVLTASGTLVLWHRFT